MKLIQIVNSCDLFFLDSGLLGEMGEGCCTHFSFFIPIGLLCTSVKFRELIPGKYCSFHSAWSGYFALCLLDHTFHISTSSIHCPYLMCAPHIHFQSLMGCLREYSETLCVITHITTSPSDSSLLLCLTTQLAPM